MTQKMSARCLDYFSTKTDLNYTCLLSKSLRQQKNICRHPAVNDIPKERQYDVTYISH